jgi:hypothetical protein
MLLFVSASSHLRSNHSYNPCSRNPLAIKVRKASDPLRQTETSETLRLRTSSDAVPDRVEHIGLGQASRATAETAAATHSS